jgi:hypothetical protein
MFVAIRSGEAAKSLNSVFPQAMSRMSSSVHLSPNRSSAQATGQIDRRFVRPIELFPGIAYSTFAALDGISKTCKMQASIPWV